MWLSIIIISILGTFFHFLYDISKHNKVVGLFAAVNESTWEHIKIALTPTILWGIYDGYIYGRNPNYFTAKLSSLLILITFIPTIFYLYKYFTNKPIIIVDILIFYIAIILSQFSFYSIIKLQTLGFATNYLSCISIFIVFGFYMVLTLLPIKSFIFKDPITNKFGFKGHS